MPCKKISTAALFLGVSLLASTAFAQTPHPTTQPQATSGQQAAVAAPTDTELKNFAHAAEGIAGIKQTAQKQLMTAKDSSARTKLEQAAQQKMKATIVSNHLSVQRYIQIAKVVQTNQTVRAKVLKMIQPAPSHS
ncbi:MAG TPA: DUF4168 domain-containing protein [Rhodanobacteraceae bacterium]